MSGGVTTYKAKANCRIGGMLRRAGEVFSLPALDKIPPHLEAFSPAERAEGAQPGKAKGKGPGVVPKDARPGKDDIGAGKVTSSAEVTSKDMVKK